MTIRENKKRGIKKQWILRVKREEYFKIKNLFKREREKEMEVTN